jgi:hypothetical protein
MYLSCNVPGVVGVTVLDTEDGLIYVDEDCLVLDDDMLELVLEVVLLDVDTADVDAIEDADSTLDVIDSELVLCGKSSQPLSVNKDAALLELIKEVDWILPPQAVTDISRAIHKKIIKSLFIISPLKIKNALILKR